MNANRWGDYLVMIALTLLLLAAGGLFLAAWLSARGTI